ncbi:MAG: Wzz/FepE/Etk N-terminal domain-containing protein [Defluviitaleaceae bacterium]|nr:Wzz/FepE/Etk N-terminal domain-containing protein [Defluviitaleaceae bacterium]
MEEISLKELIQTILRGKFIIIGITFAALVLGAVAFLLIPSRYSATANILANPITANIAGAEAELNFPHMDMDSYMELFLNTDTMRQTIEVLDLVDGNGEPLSTYALASIVTLNSTPRTNILNVSVSHRDPEMAALIANELSLQFINHVTEIYQAIAATAANVIAERIAEAEIALDIASANLREFLISSDNIDLLNAEINILTYNITNLKNELSLLYMSIDTDTRSIEALLELIADAPSTTNNPTLSTTINSRGTHTGTYNLELNLSDDISQFALNLRLTETTARRIEQTNRKDVIEENLERLEYHLQNLRATQAEEQFRYDNIIRHQSIAESTLIMYVQQYNQALMIEASNLGNLNIKIITEAAEPTESYNRNAILFGGISGAFGLFVGVLIVLFMHYWKHEAGNV